MTCREFKHDAAALTLSELATAPDGAILAHAETCGSCRGWLERQRTLAASMQVLRATTASMEARPSVEQAVLRSFRQAAPVTTAMSTRDERPLVIRSSAPFALRLSRFFEIGAYVAVAAAIVVGVFLGVRLLQHRSTMTADTVQHQTAPQARVPAVQKPAVAMVATMVATKDNVATRMPPASASEPPADASMTRVQRLHTNSAAVSAATTDSENDADAGYIPLMFCDPLSCASDSQVVRMQLPAGTSSQPQMADVIVGDDGVVRAVRMVN